MRIWSPTNKKEIFQLTMIIDRIKWCSFAKDENDRLFAARAFFIKSLALSTGWITIQRDKY